MEISKEKLMLMISESSIEMDEMGLVYNKSDLKTKSRPILDSDGNFIGHDMLIDLDNPGKGRVNVIFSRDIDEFIRNHPDLIEKLKQQYGNIKWAKIRPNKPKDFPKFNPHKVKREYLPLPDTDDEKMDVTNRAYVPSGKKYSEQQNIKRRGFNDTLMDEFGLKQPKGIEFNKELSKRSIPGIIVEDKKFIDRTVKLSNNSVVFRAHSYNTYETAQTFLKTVVQRIAGKETAEIDTTSLARQYNSINANWDEDKMNQQDYEGKTDVFGLNKRGKTESNLDVSLRMDFEIIGEKIGGDSFSWTINMKNKFGRKRPDEYRIANGLKPITLKDGGYLDEGLITVSTTVQLDPNKTFDERNTIISDVAVSEGLRQVIYDFKQEIRNINPKSALKYATINRSDVERVNESIRKISKDILKEIKK